jgi:hypothetical protein
MGKPAVPAPDGKVPAADSQVVGAGDMAVTAIGCLDKLPEIITTDFRKLSFFTNIFDPGYENPGSPAVIANNLCPVGNGRDDLVSIFFTMVAVRAVPREDETVAHGK